MKAIALLVAALFVGMVTAEVVEVDVSEWAYVGTGMTASGWDVNGITSFKDGNVRIAEIADYATSPLFPGPVTQLVMTVKVSSAETERFLTAIPVVASSSAESLTAVASTKYARQSLAWRSEDDVRKFSLKNVGKFTSGWGIASLSVYIDRIEPPQAICSTSDYSDAMNIAWQPDYRAVRHELEINRVEVFPPRYDLSRDWDFSSLTNATGSTRDLELLSTPESLNGISGTNLCLSAHAGGHLQVGKSETVGTMILPLEAKERRTALLTMFRHRSDSNGDTIVGYLVEEDERCALTNPILTSEPTTFVIDIPDEAKSIYVQTRASRRICVNDIMVVTDYEYGYAKTNQIDVVRSVKSERCVKGLYPGNYIFRMRSFDENGKYSIWSDFTAITLHAGSPKRPNPGFQLLIK